MNAVACAVGNGVLFVSARSYAREDGRTLWQLETIGSSIWVLRLNAPKGGRTLWQIYKDYLAKKCGLNAPKGGRTLWLRLSKIYVWFGSLNAPKGGRTLWHKRKSG